MFTFNKAISTVLVSAIVVIGLQGQAQASPKLDSQLKALNSISSNLSVSSSKRINASAKWVKLMNAEYNRLEIVIKKLELKRAVDSQKGINTNSMNYKIEALKKDQLKYEVGGC